MLRDHCLAPECVDAGLAALRNMRTPRAKLESLYGGGPQGPPWMYAKDDPAKLDDGDLPRSQERFLVPA